MRGKKRGRDSEFPKGQHQSLSKKNRSWPWWMLLYGPTDIR